MTTNPDNPDEQPVRRPESPARALEPKPAPTPADNEEAPAVTGAKKPRRPGRLSRVLHGLASLLLLAVIAVGVALYYGKTRFEAPGPMTGATTITIRPGMSLGQIAGMLASRDIISNAYLFQAAVMANGMSQSLKAGEYAVPAAASMRDIMELLASGKAIQYKFTVPEGLTSYQIVERLKADKNLTGEIKAVPAEGSLLPETYHFGRGMTRQQLIERMQAAQKALLDRLWPRRAANLPVKTRAEALVLASIVEKETGKAEERPHIAGVFGNRLKKNMRLQSDPTIIYGITGGRGALGRPIRRSEIRRKTPYNTYQVNGLPPTPIANPGRAAIEAVLNPLPTDDLYFVADGTGGHVFSKTLAEHRRNAVRWRQHIRQNGKRTNHTARAKSPTASSKARTGMTGKPVPAPDTFRTTPVVKPQKAARSPKGAVKPEPETRREKPRKAPETKPDNNPRVQPAKKSQPVMQGKVRVESKPLPLPGPVQ